MAKRWWQNERSLLASRVRSTRKRLRAAYRRSVVIAQAAAWKRQQEETQAAVAVTERERASLHNALLEVTHPLVSISQHQMYRTIGIELSISEELLLRARSTGEMFDAIADEIGKATTFKVREHLTTARLRRMA